MTDIGSGLGLFESFNARFLKFEDVAQTFVPTSTYSTLLKTSHAMIIGPRGSGKTTLLKMLHPAAIDAWGTRRGRKEASPRFMGIYVGCDVSWGEQLEALGTRALSVHDHNLLTIAAFTTNVLKATAVSMHYAVHAGPLVNRRSQRIKMSEQSERYLVEGLSNAWHLSPVLPNLLALKHSLAVRLTEIEAIARRLSSLPESERNHCISSYPFLFLPFLKLVSEATEMFDDAASESPPNWALLLDELEVAPAWIRQTLLKSLRASGDRLLLKLSMSPYNDDAGILAGALGALPVHDFDLIPLWYSEGNKTQDFCRVFFGEMLRERGIPDQRAEEILGRSQYIVSGSDETEETESHDSVSSLAMRAESLLGKDDSFKRFLDRKGIVIKTLALPRNKRKLQVIRNSMPIICFRDRFLTRVPRGRKQAPIIGGHRNADLFAGVSTLFAMVEGNPRWFKGIIGPLLDEYELTKKRVSPSRQLKEIAQTSERFRALLSNIECDPEPLGVRTANLLSLLDRIGSYVFRQAVLREFGENPETVIEMDARVSAGLERAVAIALHVGAVAYVPERRDVVLLKSLEKKRFRLSHLLAPHYQIPIRTGDKVALTTVLNATRPSKPGYSF